jgi:small subunit ribosomal protein S8
MSVTDPIADLLTRIRNACRAELDMVDMQHSVQKSEIARILKREGFVRDYVTEGHGGKKILKIYLKYGPDRAPIIQGLRRISKPGLRRYVGADKLPRVLGGMGMVILTTSHGLMTDKEARKARLGGEVICYVW